MARRCESQDGLLEEHGGNTFVQWNQTFKAFLSHAGGYCADTVVPILIQMSFCFAFVSQHLGGFCCETCCGARSSKLMAGTSVRDRGKIHFELSKRDC